MGSIWRAEHLVLCAPVAIKLIDPEIADDAEALDRFMREAQSAAALRSPHVVQILDYGIDQRSPFIVMELLEGENLAQRLSRVGRLSPAETARIVTHVARAIGRAHDAGVIHRDLKPDNIFIVHNEDAEVAKVVDFGVAKVDPSTLGPGATRTRTGSLLGTPYYMSPEQAQGNKHVDHRSDLWALGVIAFECMTGKRPFESDGLGDLVLQICVREIPMPSSIATVPQEFDTWFLRAMSRDPEGRFQSAREMADALREAVGAEAREAIPTLPDPSSVNIPAATPVAASDAEAPVEPPAELVNLATADRAEAATEPVSAHAAGAPTVLAETAPLAGNSATAEAPSGASSMRPAVILAVAGGALAAGLVGGLLVFGHTRSAAVDLPDGGSIAARARSSATAAVPTAPPREEHRGKAAKTGAASSSRATDNVTDAGFDVRAWMTDTDGGAERDASSRDASPREASARSAVADAGAVRGLKTDAGKPKHKTPRSAPSSQPGSKGPKPLP
jgi:eukaryotic-like serine/threonine-protein kinase